MTMDDLSDCGPDMVVAGHLPNYGAWPAFTGIYADPQDIWPPTTYPTGRGQRARNGWCCPGCGRGFSPDVTECPYYPEHPKPAAVNGRAEVPVMGEWDDDT